MARMVVAKLALTSILLTAAFADIGIVSARTAADLAQSSAAISVSELPQQGRATYELIRLGGPFPHQKDGAVFGNREQLLPLGKRGYYREYTVQTAGSKDRGARRIVCGGPARTPEACFYTFDHYASFRKIVSVPE
jgi:ribonuclease T1